MSQTATPLVTVNDINHLRFRAKEIPHVNPHPFHRHAKSTHGRHFDSANIPQAGTPGFPVELDGVGEPHAAFLIESRTLGHGWSHVQQIRGTRSSARDCSHAWQPAYRSTKIERTSEWSWATAISRLEHIQ